MSQVAGSGTDARQILEGRRVLVVEDFALIADEIREILEDQGAVVIGPSAKIEQALKAIDKHEPELAVLDVNLDGTPAFPVADELARRKVPYILATGYDESHVPEAYLSTPRITKPFTSTELVTTLARAYQNRAEA
ncbi:MAG: response regulator [Phycisphaerales bacterium]